MIYYRRAALYKIMLSFTLALGRQPTHEEKSGMIANLSRLSRDACIDVCLLTKRVIDVQLANKRRMH